MIPLFTGKVSAFFRPYSGKRPENTGIRPEKTETFPEKKQNLLRRGVNCQETITFNALYLVGLETRCNTLADNIIIVNLFIRAQVRPRQCFRDFLIFMLVVLSTFEINQNHGFSRSIENIGYAEKNVYWICRKKTFIGYAEKTFIQCEQQRLIIAILISNQQSCFRIRI